MAAAPPPPSPEEMSSFSWLFDQLKGMVGPLFGAGGLGYAWRASAKITRYELAQADLERRQDEYDKKIEILETRQRASDLVVAKLPTQEELRQVKEELRDAIVREAEITRGVVSDRIVDLRETLTTRK